MAVTWTGWIDDILRAINAPTQPNKPPPLGDSGNVGFLEDWHNSEYPLCDFNPLVAYKTGAGSTNCKLLPNSRHAQNYTSKAQAISRIAAQFMDGDYPHMLTALRDNKIYAEKTWPGVSLDLQRWGAVKAQADYANFMVNTYGGSGVPTGPPTPNETPFAPHTTHGWNELRQSLNHRLHARITQTDKALSGALRELHGGRKVGG